MGVSPLPLGFPKSYDVTDNSWPSLSRMSRYLSLASRTRGRWPLHVALDRPNGEMPHLACDCFVEMVVETRSEPARRPRQVSLRMPRDMLCAPQVGIPPNASREST